MHKINLRKNRTWRIWKSGRKGARKSFALLPVIMILCLMIPVMFSGEVTAASGYEDVASGSDVASTQQVGKYGMTPLTAEYVREGSYDISVDSSSKFFRIKEAKLLVKDGRMKAVIMIDSTSYKFIYMGSAEDAAKAPEKKYIKAEVKNGRSYFTVPVSALDEPLNCASFSSNTRKWYGRQILFDATTLPSGALTITLPDYNKIQAAVNAYDNGDRKESTGSDLTRTGDIQPSEPLYTSLGNGKYSIEVSMTGGSGRASIASPAYLYVRKHRFYSKITWSSSHYDYMIVGGKKYLNESRKGEDSTFTIPVTAIDEPMIVKADTTALGDPVEIEYHLTFYEKSIGSVDQIPQIAAKKVLTIALVLIIAGGILNYFVKSRKRQ